MAQCQAQGAGGGWVGKSLLCLLHNVCLALSLSLSRSLSTSLSLSLSFSFSRERLDLSRERERSLSLLSMLLPFTSLLSLTRPLFVRAP
jgi:hypothetical protein